MPPRPGTRRSSLNARRRRARTPLIADWLRWTRRPALVTLRSDNSASSATSRLRSKLCRSIRCGAILPRGRPCVMDAGDGPDRGGYRDARDRAAAVVSRARGAATGAAGILSGPWIVDLYSLPGVVLEDCVSR